MYIEVLNFVTRTGESGNPIEVVAERNGNGLVWF